MRNQNPSTTIEKVLWQTKKISTPLTHIAPVFLRYYLVTTHPDIPKDRPAGYGIAIEKEMITDGVVCLERKTICDIFTDKKLCQSFLNTLTYHLVFPTSLSEIVSDALAS